MFKVKILPLLLSLLLLTSCSSAKVAEIKADGSLSADVKSVGTASSEPSDGGYILATQNEKYSLYYEPTGLTVRIVNNITGAVTESAAPAIEGSSDTWKNFVNSGIVLEYYKGDAININKTNMYSGKPATKISLIENGFAAELNFKNIGVSLTVFITLNDDGIKVQVPNSSIKEINKNYRLAAIYVLPFLGYTHLGDVDGYMLIPDGCGATIALNNNNGKFTQPYKSKVYGGNYSVESNTYTVQKYDDKIATTADTAEVFAPVFGMVHKTNNTAFLGVIENGKYNAEIYAYPNGVVTDYNWITARYVYRAEYQYLTGQSGSIRSTQKDRETFDISVCYRFTSGEDADYTGLAKSYREYLKENGVLRAEKEFDYGMRLDFFAGDVEKGLFGNDFVTMTSVEQIDEILNGLKKDGVKNLDISLKGWQKGGIYGNIIGKADFEGSVGSLKDYVKLAEKYSDMDFLLYGDFLNVYAKSSSKDYIYQYNGKVFSDETFWELHPIKYRYNAPTVKKHIESTLKSLKKAENIGICFDGITDEVYSYDAGEKMKMFSRKYAAELNAQTLREVSAKRSTAYVAPNDYLWSSLERYYDYKVYGSDYKFVTDEVPFFAIALKGSMPIYGEYVNFKADTTEYKLKLIESGVYPSFLLTNESPSNLIYTDSASLFSCEYSEYKAMIKEYNEIFTELYAVTGNSAINDHINNNGLAVTTYENGAQVIVNYNKSDASYNGNTVKGQSYLLIDGKAGK